MEKTKYVKLVEEACRAKDKTKMKKEMTEKFEEKNQERSWSKLQRMVKEDRRMKVH